MNNPNLPDSMQSITDKSLPWNVKECSECGTEDFKNSDCDTCRYMHGMDPHDNEVPDMNRQCYSTNELAVAGAVEQMAQHETIGDQASVDDSAARHQARVQARFDSDKRDNDQRAILRKRNQEAIAVKELTKEQVYPKRRGF